MSVSKRAEVHSDSQGLDVVVRAIDPEVEKDGKLVCQLRDAPTELVEEFVRRVRARSGQKVDWCYVNKMPTTYTTGDVNRVMIATLDALDEFDGITLYSATDEN